MSIFDIFSKRQKRLRGEMPDVYRYDEIPNKLRVQIVHIIQDAIGVDGYGHNGVEKLYDEIKNILCREYGVFELIKYPKNSIEEVINFFLQEKSVEHALDVVEVCFRAILNINKFQEIIYYSTRKLEPDEAISELNERFKENGVGFQFESGELIRVDSEFLHVEAVKPTLTILRGREFKGANEEFLSAHEHYRHGRYKECLVDSLKAFESTMKSICKMRRWSVPPTAPAKTLIDVCCTNQLFPTSLQTQLGSLRSLLESGIPTVRNKFGGHGQGSDVVSVPDYFARYALHLTATNILFLVEANNNFGTT